MKRQAESHLRQWYKSPHRMPLILRGARQVGKSTLVRLFCENSKIDLIEINLEKMRLRSSANPDFHLQDITDEIQLRSKKKITPNTIIFFDEIQEDPVLLSRLRYFYEEQPDLAIIAAGSLLELTINTEKFSFPVGRVEFYHLGPMTFTEYLWATKNDLLAAKLEAMDLSDAVFVLAKEELRKFYYVGGMPKAVQVYIEDKSLVSVREIQEQILQTYIADFPKYNSRINLQRIEKVFAACVHQLGKKIIYQKLDSESKSRDIRRIVELLIDARILLRCNHTSGNLAPLLGETDPSVFKLYFLDIGLVNALLRLDLETLDHEMSNNFSTKGFLAEQFVAQHLAYINGHKNPPELFYWLREKNSAKGEIDFIIQNGNHIYPIEVKSTQSGHLKSLFYFAKEKSSQKGFKISLAPYSSAKVTLRIDSRPVSFELTSLPHFAIEHILKCVQ